MNTNTLDFTQIRALAIAAAAVIIPMLVLSASLSLPMQMAKGLDKRDPKITAEQLDQAKKINIKQVTDQKASCKNTDCPVTGSNVVCLPGAICRFTGHDDNPLIISTPY
jgi:hypothetical protein